MVIQIYKEQYSYKNNEAVEVLKDKANGSFANG